MKVIPCTDSAVQGNDFELIPTIRMERGHSVNGSFSRHFSSIYISLWSYIAAWSRKSFARKWVLGKTTPDFENFIPKGFTTSQNHVLCANFVKFGRLEIGKVVRYLPHRKTKNRLALPLSLLRGSRPKSARASFRQYTRSAPNFIQICW